MCYCWPLACNAPWLDNYAQHNAHWTPKHGEPLSHERRRGPHKAVHTRHISSMCDAISKVVRVSSLERFPRSRSHRDPLSRRNLWSLRLLFPKAIRMIHNHRMSTVQSVSHMSHCAATPRRATWVVATRPGVRYLLTCTHCAAAGRRWHSSGCGRGTSIANSLTSLHASTPCLPHRGLAN